MSHIVAQVCLSKKFVLLFESNNPWDRDNAMKTGIPEKEKDVKDTFLSICSHDLFVVSNWQKVLLWEFLDLCDIYLKIRPQSQVYQKMIWEIVC